MAKLEAAENKPEDDFNNLPMVPAENKPEDDFNNLPMVPSFAQTTEDKAKEDLHDVLEKMSKELNPNIQDLDTGIESSNETHGDGSMKGKIIPETKQLLSTNDDKKGKVLY